MAASNEPHLRLSTHPSGPHARPLFATGHSFRAAAWAKRRTHLRNPVNSAIHSGRNPPAFPVQSSRGSWSTSTTFPDWTAPGICCGASQACKRLAARAPALTTRTVAYPARTRQARHGTTSRWVSATGLYRFCSDTNWLTDPARSSRISLLLSGSLATRAYQCQRCVLDAAAEATLAPPRAFHRASSPKGGGESGHEKEREGNS